MQRMRCAVGVIVLAIVLGATASIWGQDEQTEENRRTRGCSQTSLRGNYGIQIQGTRPSGPGGPIESVIGVAIRKYDGGGNFTQVGNTHGSISGTTLGQAGWGTYEVDANCSGVAYLQLDGAPFVIEERIVVVDNGLEVRSMSANPPPVIVTGVHRKTSVR